MHAPPGGGQGGPVVKASGETPMLNHTATPPPACALADRKMPSRLRGGGGREGVSKQRVETAVETAVMIQGQAHRKTMKCPRLNPLALIQGKRR
jgi:hypothetical protein